MTEEDEYYSTLLGITELLKYGTTCFVDPGSTKYLDACMQAYEESGCRIVVGANARSGGTSPCAAQTIALRTSRRKFSLPQFA